MTRTLDPASSRTIATIAISTHMIIIPFSIWRLFWAITGFRGVVVLRRRSTPLGSGRSGARFLRIGSLRVPPHRAAHYGQDDAGESAGDKPGEQQHGTEQHRNRNRDLAVRSALRRRPLAEVGRGTIGRTLGPRP